MSTAHERVGVERERSQQRPRESQIGLSESVELEELDWHDFVATSCFGRPEFDAFTTQSIIPLIDSQSFKSRWRFRVHVSTVGRFADVE